MMDTNAAKKLINLLADELPDTMPTGVPKSIKIVLDYGSFEMSVKTEGAKIERQLAE